MKIRNNVLKNRWAALLGGAALLSMSLIPVLPASAQDYGGYENYGEANPPSQLYNQTYTLNLNDKPLTGINPMMMDGSLYVPLREVAEQTGLSVNYIASTNTIEVFHGNQVASLPVGSRQASMNDQVVFLDNETIVRDGRAWIPVRTFERLWDGARVNWDDDNGIASIYVEPGFPEQRDPNTLTEGFVDPLDRNTRDNGYDNDL
ncbi:MAG: hypothetical protein OHK0029_39990 [Armatimonadaceae bacterium]